MVKPKYRPQGYGNLVRATVPVRGDQPESVKHWLYDTATYTDNATVQLTLFTTARGDLSLSNLDSPGSLAEGTFFRVDAIHMDYINNVAGNHYVSTAAANQTGALNDCGRLMLNGRGRLTLTLSDKRYGPWPLSAFHGTGAAQGFMAGTAAATNMDQYGFAGPIDGGGWLGGTIVIPAKASFSIVIDWPAAIDLQNDYRVRCSLEGLVYRPIR